MEEGVTYAMEYNDRAVGGQGKFSVTGCHTQAMPTGNEDSLVRVSETYMLRIEASIVIIITTSVKILIGYIHHVSSAYHPINFVQQNWKLL